MNRKFLTAILALALAQLAMAQTEKNKTKSVLYNDQLYKDETMGSRRAVPYDHLRQASVSWEKRIWRTIDLREKMNQHLMFPEYPTQNRIALLDLIKRGIESGELILFDDEAFTQPLSREQAIARFGKEITIEIIDSFGIKKGDTTVLEILGPDKITQFKIKEDYYFDNSLGMQQVRILGICPVYYDEGKDLYIEKGWIYFPQARNMFVNYETFNPKNNAATISFDDLFHKRFFSSFIQKESNVYDRYISQYTAGLESLCEAERVKKEIYQWEHDLWHF